MSAADPAASAGPPFNTLVTSDGGVQFQSSAPLVFTQFAEERELVRTPGAVQQGQSCVRVMADGMIDHRPQRRDACASRDEQQPLLRRWFRRSEEQTSELQSPCK